MAEGFDLSVILDEIKDFHDKAHAEYREGKMVVIVSPRILPSVRVCLEGLDSNVEVKESLAVPTDTIIIMDPKFLGPFGVISGAETSGG